MRGKNNALHRAPTIKYPTERMMSHRTSHLCLKNSNRLMYTLTLSCTLKGAHWFLALVKNMMLVNLALSGSFVAMFILFVFIEYLSLYGAQRCGGPFWWDSSLLSMCSKTCTCIIYRGKLLFSSRHTTDPSLKLLWTYSCLEDHESLCPLYPLHQMEGIL